MFSSITSFNLSTNTFHLLFIDSSLDLFSFESDPNIPTSLLTTNVDVYVDIAIVEVPTHSPRRSTRVSVLLSHLQDYYCYYAFATLHEL